MASARMFEFMVMWQAIFIPLVALYGASVGVSFSDSLSGLSNTINAPFLDFQSMLKTIGFTGFINCGLLDFNCNSGNIQQATVYAGAIIGYAGLLAFQVMQKIGAGVFLIVTLSSFFGNSFGIPFLGQVEFGFLALTLVFGLALIKPGGHGTS